MRALSCSCTYRVRKSSWSYKKKRARKLWDSFNPSRPGPGWREVVSQKILWRFHKTWCTTKRCQKKKKKKKKKFIYFLLFKVNLQNLWKIISRNILLLLHWNFVCSWSVVLRIHRRYAYPLFYNFVFKCYN